MVFQTTSKTMNLLPVSSIPVRTAGGCVPKRIKSRLPLLIAQCLLVYAVAAQDSADQVWRSPTLTTTASAEQRRLPHLRQCRQVVFDRVSFLNRIDGIGREEPHESRQPETIISLPHPSGGFKTFVIIESPIMEAGLAARFSAIRTFRGHEVDAPGNTVRLTLAPSGLHVSVSCPGGTDYYLDPFYHGDDRLNACYTRSHVTRPGATDAAGVVLRKPHRCKHRPALSPAAAAGFAAKPASVRLARTTAGATLRTYRLAVAATGEYTQFHGGTVAGGQAAIVAAVNRVNQIYENDLAVRFTLVANNSSAVYVNGATDPYTDNDPDMLIQENTTNLNQVLGVSNYDIGHVFSTGGGGLAGGGVVCDEFAKGEGVTGSDNPTGDPFWVDFVAHEIGHQFNANHTFNSAAPECVDQRASTAAYSPGSGSSIMSYAGICGTDDLQSNSHASFHSESLREMLDFIATIPNCGTSTATGNTPPTANAGSDYTIPRDTPFVLNGSATDSNNDPLTYSWEQRDLGPAQTLAQVTATDNGQSPLFRIYAPSMSSARTFPRLTELLNNTTPTGERLPSVNRNMNFRLVVRDNRAGGGGIDTDDMVVTVHAAAGPFRVTAPNSVTSLAPTAQTVTWDVANTTAAPINTVNVRILLSTDGGNTYPTVLAASTANDGSESVNLPNVNTTAARIRIEAVGSVYFDISDANFTITGTGGAAQFSLSTPRVVGNNFTASFITDTQGNYRLERSADMRTWNTVFDFSQAAASATLIHTNGAAAIVRRFYRVRIR